MSHPKSNQSIHELRRSNLSNLLTEFSALRLAEGEPMKGIESAFATHISVSRVTLSHLKSSRNISDKVARQIESACDKEAGWLDVEHQAALPSKAEEEFLALAKQSWRQANAKEKRELMRLAKKSFF